MGNKIFDRIQLSAPSRSYFDLSHDVKLTCEMGLLVPTMAIPTLPGDKFNIGCDSLVRLPPLVAPVMHRMDVFMHYFYVPNRLLWSNWDKFITQTPVAGSIPTPPTIIVEASGANYTRLHDYMGIPDPNNMPVVTNDEVVDALPFAAYQLIYNEYYRDQNLIAEVPFALVDGDNTVNTDLYRIRKRAWEHDYLTSSLPFAQKGAAVTLPLSFNDVPVVHDVNVGLSDTSDWNVVRQPSGIADSINVERENITNTASEQLYAETSSLVGNTTISDLRRATKLQQFLEKMARAGSRVTEYLRSIWNVRSPDARLQRPEYITGTKSPIIVSEVLNTSDTASAPQGNMAGHAVSVQQGKYGGHYCYEHGWIIGIMSVMPKTSYTQGIDRKFLKRDAYDYATPEFQNIGEQEVYNREVFAFRATADQNGTFGYIPRYAEYKYENNRVAGEFRSFPLDSWHMARIFTAPPALNQTFIECDPTTRIFPVLTGADTCYVQVLHKVGALRPLQKYGNPSAL